MRTSLLIILLFTLIGNAKGQLFGKHWETGYYYDLQGKKEEGLISFEFKDKYSLGTSDYIFFKSSKEGEQIKLSSKSIQSFVIHKDSFIVSHIDYLAKNPF